MQSNGPFCTSSRPSTHLRLEFLFCGLLRDIADNIVEQVAPVAVLLKDKSASNTGAEAVELDILQPNVPVGHQVWVGELREELDLH